VDSLFDQLAGCNDTSTKSAITCDLIIAIFDLFYAELCQYPHLAQSAFEKRDPVSSIEISKLSKLEELWDDVEKQYRFKIENRYEADIAFSFAHSIARRIYQGEWKPVAYSFSSASESRTNALASAYTTIQIDKDISEDQVVSILCVANLKIEFADIRADARKIVSRVADISAMGEYEDVPLVQIDVLNGGFYRDLGAFIVGRVVKASGEYAPFVIALLNDHGKVRVDALLHKTADAHNLLSSTLANFHVTNELYYQTCVFLYSIMPRRPLGLHYSTIGFNHVGKVAVLEELKQQMRDSGSVLASSPGFEGTVAIGFTFESSTYHLKVIRNKPTKSYKWGEFEGIDAVLDKYRIVHQINRTGSMVDNIIYHNLRLHRDMFDDALLADILSHNAER